MPLLVNIKKSFGSFRLDVSFETEGGSITGLLGASGCGKSVTLKCIAGIETPDEGKIILNDQILFDSDRRINLSPQKRRVGYLFQNYALFPNMTVAQNIAAGVRSRARRGEVTARLVRALYLEGSEFKYPRQLSGGQQQRTALARILASEPEVLMLDEPFSALDSYLKWQVELELTELLTTFQGPVLYVTHDRDEIYRNCKQVCVLERGSSQPLQPLQQLFDHPATLSACLLSGTKNISRARALGGKRLEAVDWGVELTCSAPFSDSLAYVGARSHYLRPAGGPGPNRIHCRVQRVVEEVFSTVVLLATPGGTQGRSRLRLELPKEEWAALSAPEQLWLEIPQNALLPLSEQQR